MANEYVYQNQDGKWTVYTEKHGVSVHTVFLTKADANHYCKKLIREQKNGNKYKNYT